MMLTVKKLADLAGISVRTLHYYDEVGLLKPEFRSRSGYRQYGGESVLRLQQILFYRELDFSLDEIRNILNRQDFNVKEALADQRILLKKKEARVRELIATIDKTIKNKEGVRGMQIKDYYKGFSEDDIERYRDEVRRRWGSRTLEESEKKVLAIGQDAFIELQAGGGRIFKSIFENMAGGYASPQVQEQVARWRQWLENFHHYTDEEVLGLGRAYSQNPEFARFFRQYSVDLPAFLTGAIEYYCSHCKTKPS